MDLAAVRALFDKRQRAEPPSVVGVERTWFDGVLRTTTGADHFINWWDFPSDRMTAIVEREAAHFRAIGGDLQWRVYGHDRPEGLERALADAGFEDRGVEKLLALEVSAAANLERPPNVDVRPVRTEEELAGYVAVLRNAFGDEGWATQDLYRPWLTDPTMALFLAYVGGEPAATGRLETPRDFPFAGLSDGAVVPHYRAAEAGRRRAHYLLVNARETSRPILERLGFEPLATRHGWMLKAPSPSSTSA
jgi:hypothetical protein